MKKLFANLRRRKEVDGPWTGVMRCEYNENIKTESYIKFKDEKYIVNSIKTQISERRLIKTTLPKIIKTWDM